LNRVANLSSSAPLRGDCVPRSTGCSHSLKAFCRQLLGGVALSVLLVSASGAAKADESNAELAAAGSVRDTWEITAGFWDKVYQGDFGSLRVGLQYAYNEDELFNGNGTSGGHPALSNVHYNDQQIYASLRYYPFDPPPPAPPVVAKY
jgi:hypothetical protein